MHQINTPTPPSDYEHQRAQLVASERSRMVGHELPLSQREWKADRILASIKRDEYDRQGNDAFIPASVFDASIKARMEESPLFRLLRKLPKGGLLHLHSQSAVRLGWLIKNATYDPHCHVCYHNHSGVSIEWQSLPVTMNISFHFFPLGSAAGGVNQPTPPCLGTRGWRSVPSERAAMDAKKGNGSFDAFLLSTMTRNFNQQRYLTNSSRIWKEFEMALHVADTLLAYHPVWRNYNWRLLETLVEDKVQYVELRSLMQDTYDLSGKVYHKKDFLYEYEQLLARFKEEHPSFIDARIIGCSSRNIDGDDFIHNLKEASILQKLFPKLYMGYDLVGREDTGKSLYHFHRYLEKAGMAREHVKFFFHGGETDWSGQQVDYNLYDAILLNTERIGHGIAFSKHPHLMSIIKERNIPIEVCPISNQVLGYVHDLREHPGSLFVKTNTSFVISSDDPSMWDIEGLTYDWYDAFMGFDTLLGLPFLKKMAINSLQYAAMSSSDIANAMQRWEIQWNIFIDYLIDQYQDPQS
eukprot:Nk52_evm17s211 gene=Nk52_evmTU17s211